MNSNEGFFWRSREFAHVALTIGTIVIPVPSHDYKLYDYENVAPWLLIWTSSFIA
jgi:hypothetical protein